MGSQLIKILKAVGLLSLVIIALEALGNGLNYLIPWHWLTDFFSILKFFSSQINFMWDMTSMWAAISIVLTLEILKYAFIAAMAVIKWFKNA